ncbi:MAG: DNA ligase [Desulfobacteraceae bacterium]|nr:MAG: DNA ligase [Desulfobacteraceae bacterium]
MPEISTTEIEQLVRQLEIYNASYRKGELLISDPEYDQLVERLRTLDPSHPFLHHVEPESFEGKKEIRHPVPMLSIEKAYSREELERFVNRVKKEASEIGVLDIRFIVTPKLDGLAGRDDGEIFASRGNGEVGYEISSAFEKGIIPLGGRGRGIGEIVIQKSYFDEHLSTYFEHPRNLVVGIINSDKLNEYAVKAIEDRAVCFVPYAELESWTGTPEELLDQVEEITRELSSKTDFPMDGMVAGVMDETVREKMGATAHHYRWQIAIKTKGETAVTHVKNIVWQVGRTGSVTPVMEIVPVSLSGATIKRVTAHNAGKVRTEKIGPGAEIEIIRSGEVIPKLEKVIIPSEQVELPGFCPSCHSSLVWDNDFLKCMASSCPAQVEQGIMHFFKILGTAEWFGIKTVQKLVMKGFSRLEKIYVMTEQDFLEMGFGPVQSKNLWNAIQTSISKPVEDWRFLAAFGIPDLGTGDSRNLLSHFRLEELGNIRKEEIVKIHGFGEKTGESIQKGIEKVWDTIEKMLHIGFVLEKTPLEHEKQTMGSPIAGKGIVFTGKMKTGSREDMQVQARKLGANVQTAVSGKTEYLVCGENVGAGKIKKAKEVDAVIITEEEYLQMIRAAKNRS